MLNVHYLYEIKIETKNSAQDISLNSASQILSTVIFLTL